MATYYVKPASQGGSNSNNGLSAATAWATVAYALTSASGFASGDTLYVAPGIYTNVITVTMSNPTTETNIIGDVTASQFSGITPGVIVLTNFNSTLTGIGTAANLISATTKNYLHFQNIQFKLYDYSIVFTTCSNLKFTKCTVFQKAVYVNALTISSATGQPVNATITKCVFIGGNNCLSITGQNIADTTSISDCIFMGALQIGLQLTSVQANVYNSTFFANNFAGIRATSGSVTYPTAVRNCLCWGSNQDLWCANVNNTIIENYNRLLSFTPRTNVADNFTSSNGGDLGVDTFESLLYGLPKIQPFTSYINSPNSSFGNITGAPLADIYGNAWSGVSPDTGAGTYAIVATQYLPTERNASTITIAPGSTSQSIELYLGATGLTASTSGLSAYYNRTRSADVQINLQSRNITQAWTSGGFAEVNPNTMPGVYRLDIPNEALASGADDVTVVVRGASGTNGAVMSIKLSSGGLTSAQTASAVWNALTNDHTTHGTFGWNVLRADQDSKEGLVTLHQSGGVSRVDADIHAIVNDTDAATELKGALLHNGTDYISADLLTPVSAATSVHIGPYQLLADGLGADQPLDVNVGTATSIDVQVTDANGTGIDITGATVSAKVYNSGGTLVATYNGTATYADNGRLSFGLTTTVTNTSGTYTVTVTRTTGASDTQVFGPLKLYVRPV